jgi:hypothetical protein
MILLRLALPFFLGLTLYWAVMGSYLLWVG